MQFVTSNNTPRNRREHHHEDFMEDLQQALLQNQKKYQVGIDEFEKVYKRKKLVSQTLDDYRHQNQTMKDNINRTRQRLYQIEQLNNRAVKQTVLMRNQIEKINEAHMMSKILMLEKIVKKEKEAQQMIKKKNQYFRIRAQKYRSMLNRSDRNISRQQRNRNMSMIESKALKQSIQQRKFSIIEDKKTKADEVRQATRRQKQRRKRYEQFKLDRAKKNYFDKAMVMKEQLEMKEREFEQAYLKQLEQEKIYEDTQKITTDYINTLFPTQTI